MHWFERNPNLTIATVANRRCHQHPLTLETIYNVGSGSRRGLGTWARKFTCLIVPCSNNTISHRKPAMSDRESDGRNEMKEVVYFHIQELVLLNAVPICNDMYTHVVDLLP